MSDLHMEAIDVEEEYARQMGMFYVGGDGGGDGGGGGADLHHSISAPVHLTAPAPRPRSSSASTSPSPSYQPIHDAFSTWDDAPIVQPKAAAVVSQTVSKESVMEKYQARERKFYDRFLSNLEIEVTSPPPIPGTPLSPTSPVPCSNLLTSDDSIVSLGSTILPLDGTDHLTNLVRLLEQLSILQEQNQALRKKCAYLEDVKTLLRVRSTKERGAGAGGHNGKAESLITRAQSKVRHYLSTPANGGTGGRRESRLASDSSDTGGRRRSLHKRSQSVGSIDLLDSDLNAMVQAAASVGGSAASPRSRSADKHHHGTSPGRMHSSSSSKKHKRFSKWMRVKKVFSSKQEQQSKSLDGGMISAEQLVRSNSKHVPRLKHMASVDDHLLASREDRSKSVSHILDHHHHHQVPPSPSSVQSEPHSEFIHEDEDDYEEEYMSHPQSSSTPSTDGFPTLQTANRMKQRSSSMAVDILEASLSDTEYAERANVHQIQRRKSSPTLGFFRTEGNEEFIAGSLAKLSRSSSLTGSLVRDKSPSLLEDPKQAKSSWQKVKDIIHTKKGSFKSRKRSVSAGGNAGTDADSETSPDTSSWEGKAPLQTELDVPQSPISKAANVAGAIATASSTPKLMRRYTARASASPRGSQKRVRRRGGSVKGTPDSPSITKRERCSEVGSGGVGTAGTTTLGTSPPPDLSALLGGMSDEFSKKMQEWEEKKKQDATFNTEGNMALDAKNKDGSAKFSEEFIQKMEAWERMKSIKGATSPKRTSLYESNQPSPVSMSPPNRQSSPSNEQPKNLSESFSKTVQEWQRVKETRAKTTSSPTPESQPSLVHSIAKPFDHRKSRKDTQRSKSRDRDRDKSKQRLEKERQKIEKKEKKIEQERQKLEQLKMKLDLETTTGGHHHHHDHQQGGAGLTDDFVKKLHEWEVMNGIKRQDSDKHKRTGSEKLGKDVGAGGGGVDRGGMDRLKHRGSLPPETGLVSSSITDSSNKDTKSTEETETEYRIKLAAENARLREELEEKEEDLALTQDELEQLTCRFNMMNKEHSEQTENFKRELWATSRLGKYTIESDLLSATIIELRNKMAYLKNYDEQVWAAKEEVEARSIKEHEARHGLESTLLCEIEQLQVALDRRLLHRHGPEVLHQLYQYVIGIQDKLYDLRLGVIERNRVIEELRRHLLVQEVTNKLMLADTTRKDLELAFFKNHHKGGVIKRWKTFSGSDHAVIHKQLHLLSTSELTSATTTTTITTTTATVPNEPSSPQDTVLSTKASPLPQSPPASISQLSAIPSASLLPSAPQQPPIPPGGLPPAPGPLHLLPAPEVPASCRQIEHSMQALAHGFGDSLNLHFDWLEGLKQQIKEIHEGIEQGIQTDRAALEEKESQTVMTLCRAASYLPVSGRSTPPNDKASQTEVVAVIPRTTTSSTSSQVTKPPTQTAATSPIIKPMRIQRQGKITSLRLSAADSSESGGDGRASSVEEPCSPIGKAVEESSKEEGNGVKEGKEIVTAKSRHEECRPIIKGREDRKVKEISTHSIVQKAVHKDENIETETRQNLDKAKETSIDESVLRTKKPEYEAERRKSTGGYVLETTTASSHKQPPVSPIIRSKYPRKLKTTDVRIHQLYGDGRTWKATPPRRMIRHRRPCVEGAGGGDGKEEEKEDAEGNVEPPVMRERTRSDSAMFHPKVSQPSLSVPTTESTGVLWSVNRLDKPPPPVLDLVNRYEVSGSGDSGGSRPLSQESRLSPGALRKPTVSPVRRLKTAAELLQDSEVRRRSRSATRDGRNDERWQSPSSRGRARNLGKENSIDTPPTSSHVRQLVRQLSRDSTPTSVASSVDHDEDAHKSDLMAVSLRLRSSSASELPGKSSHPFHDMTNEGGGLVQKMKQSLLNSSGESSPRATPPKVATKKLHEVPKEGTVLSTKEKFESPDGKEERVESSRQATAFPPIVRQRPMSCPRSVSDASSELVWELAASPSAPTASSVPASTSSSCTSISTQPVTKKSLFARKSCPAEPGSGRKNNKTMGCSGGGGSGGAISALCMHAASLDLEDDGPQQQPLQHPSTPQPSTSTQTEQTTTLEKKKPKAKFLDANWLPKKFFRVSNGYLEMDASTEDAEGEPSPVTLWCSNGSLHLDSRRLPQAWSSNIEESVC